MRVRVLIADDSSVARGILRAALEADGGIEVVGEAGDGRKAADLCAQLNPDLVTMDLRMPVMDGLEAIGRIMAATPVPILVVSAAGDAALAYEAIQRGALETVGKDDLADVPGPELAAKVKVLANVKVITHLRPSPGNRLPDQGPVQVLRTEVPRAVAIAASTGGPQALARIFCSLPKTFPCPILVAQHMTDGFAPGLAKWLSAVCSLPVRVPGDGEPLLAGGVYLSPSERNLVVTPELKAGLVDRNEKEVFHPTCDVLFASLAEACGPGAVGIILTGMGRDGALGLLKIREAGGQTLAQDQDTSVIFGMNKAAIDLGAVRQVLPLDQIAGALGRLAGPGFKGVRP